MPSDPDDAELTESEIEERDANSAALEAMLADERKARAVGGPPATTPVMVVQELIAHWPEGSQMPDGSFRPPVVAEHAVQENGERKQLKPWRAPTPEELRHVLSSGVTLAGGVEPDPPPIWKRPWVKYTALGLGVVAAGGLVWHFREPILEKVGMGGFLGGGDPEPDDDEPDDEDDDGDDSDD